MDQIKSIGLIICILMVLMAYLKQVIPRGKTTYLMKAIISIFILLSIVKGVFDFDFKTFSMTLENGYSKSEDVWNKAADLVAGGLKQEFESFLQEQSIDAQVVEISVERSEEYFEIVKVIVSGSDARTAKNLLAGRYRIGLSNIEVKNE